MIYQDHKIKHLLAKISTEGKHICKHKILALKVLFLLVFLSLLLSFSFVWTISASLGRKQTILYNHIIGLSTYYPVTGLGC